MILDHCLGKPYLQNFQNIGVHHTNHLIHLKPASFRVLKSQDPGRGHRSGEVIASSDRRRQHAARTLFEKQVLEL